MHFKTLKMTERRASDKAYGGSMCTVQFGTLASDIASHDSSHHFVRAYAHLHDIQRLALCCGERSVLICIETTIRMIECE